MSTQATAQCHDRIAATKCEVHEMISQAQFSLQPGNPVPANVAVTLQIMAVSSFQPSKQNGAANYSGSATLTLTAYNGTAATVDVSCATTTPSALSYYGYSGSKITDATNIAITATPAAAATPPALSIAAAAAEATSTVSGTTTAVTSFTPNNLWSVSMSGQYLCTITPADTAYAPATVLVPVHFSS